MADPPKEDQPQQRPDIRYDDIVANVVSDPSKGSQATLLVGYVGRGEQGRVRVYPDLSFSTYHDVAEDDIVHSVPVPDAPHGGSYVWVKSSATAAGGAAAAGARAAGLPFTVYPQYTCGFFCHTQQDCPGGAAFAAQAPLLGPTAYLTCPPLLGPTAYLTCPPHICTETMPPTRHVTCPPHICTETMAPTRVLTCDPRVCYLTQAQAPAAAAALEPTPTATFFHTCGVQCQSGIETIVCTQHAGCRQQTVHHFTCPVQICGPAGQAAAAAMPTPTTTFNPTQCTRCFICPPVTAPQTRSGVFCPYGA